MLTKHFEQTVILNSFDIFGTLVTLHVICDVTDIAQYRSLKIQGGGHMRLCTVSNFEVFPSKFVFENVGNK